MSRALRTTLLIGLAVSMGQVWAAGPGFRAEKGGSKKQPPQRVLLAQAPSGGASTAGAPVAGDTAIPPTPRFDIARFDVQGNTILDPAEVTAAVAPFSGISKEFADVQRALEALQDRYRARGFSTVQVNLPEQDLESGVVVLSVVEPRLGKVIVEGNKFFDEENIRRSFPSLQEGQTPNVAQIARNSFLVGYNASKQAQVSLRAGETDGQVDAVVRVQDQKFWRANISFDNTGTPSTGVWRLGFGYQHSNLFNRDHSLTLQYVLDPEPLDRYDDLKVFGFGYNIPLYDRSASIDVYGGYSSIGGNPGQLISGAPFSLTGSGTVVGAQYNYQLPRLEGWPGLDHRLTVGLSYKAFSTHGLGPVVNGVVQPVIPDVTVYPLVVRYLAVRALDRTVYAGGVEGVHNMYPHGNDASSETFNGPAGVRPGVGRPSYTLWRYLASMEHTFDSNAQVNARVVGQWTRDALIAGEQFGLGGWENLRGMHERELSMDRGMLATLELRSPNYARFMELAEGGSFRLLAFYDYGYVRQNFRGAQVCDAGTCRNTATSVGLGMRLRLERGFSMRLDYGRLVDPGVVGNKGDSRVHFGMAVSF